MERMGGRRSEARSTDEHITSIWEVRVRTGAEKGKLCFLSRDKKKEARAEKKRENYNKVHKD